MSIALQSVCVFCGARSGARPEYLAAASSLGAELAKRRLRLIYGGARVGLMGALADAALAGGAEVIGVIPDGLVKRELAHDGLTALHVVESMHERKALMSKLSDAVIALPGGYGTWEELFEVITWAQIGLHQKPIGTLDIADYFAPLRAMIEHGVREGFVPQSHAGVVLTATTASELLERLAAARVLEPTFPTPNLPKP